ncbi:MAG TPA: UDP-N-acetylmuramoyl-L-alanine--D-glutamate ligase [Candidatus Krumholzibacteria bacterium]|nr:UDP-N-acetylmuramoyl-L-alanine--D-glutamate ligase [Candidatus Krumholzibacteria bacterium]
MTSKVLPAHEAWTDTVVGVLGLGRSGRGAVALLERHGAQAIAFDDRSPADLPGDVVAELAEWGVEFRAARDDVRGTVSVLDALVVSPGVPSEHPLVRAAEQRGTSVIGELELASRRARGRILAVTGTNGKSTTVSLVHAILRQAGHDAVLVGNIGTAVSDHVEEVDENGLLVIECSSFQLERVEHFAPAVAAVLNLAPDHLDRYPSFEAYGEAKRNILRASTPSTAYVYPVDQAPMNQWAEDTPARRAGFARDRAENTVTWIEDGWIVRRSEAGPERVLALDTIPLVGGHNQMNVLAAVAMVHDLDLDPGGIAEAVAGFRGLPHRAVTVDTDDGRTWIDDSKATNVHAATATLRGLSGRVVALFGGRGKGEDYTPLADHSDRLRVAVCFGEEGQVVAEAIGDRVRCITCADMRTALSRACQLAEVGDTVLLSPACASFDEFGSFAERGEVFQEWVRTHVGGAS